VAGPAVLAVLLAGRTLQGRRPQHQSSGTSEKKLAYVVVVKGSTESEASDCAYSAELGCCMQSDVLHGMRLRVSQSCKWVRRWQVCFICG
jgi:hypothetical protein